MESTGSIMGFKNSFYIIKFNKKVFRDLDCIFGSGKDHVYIFINIK